MTLSQQTKTKLALYFALQWKEQRNAVYNIYQQSCRLAQQEAEKAQIAIDEATGLNVSDSERKQHDVRLQFYSVVYPKYLRNNTFLMLFSLFEESMTCAYRLISGAQFPSSKDGIKRFKKPFRDFELDLFGKNDWAFLLDCQKVRNALLHANGRIDLLRDDDKIKCILERYDSYFESVTESIIEKSRIGEVVNGRIAVKGPGVDKIYQAMVAIMDDLLKQTGIQDSESARTTHENRI